MNRDTFEKAKKIQQQIDEINDKLLLSNGTIALSLHNDFLIKIMGEEWIKSILAFIFDSVTIRKVELEKKLESL